MRKFLVKFIGNTSMTFGISGLVVFCILGAISIVSAFMYMTLSTSTLDASRDRTAAGLRVATTVAQGVISGAKASWSNEGEIQSLTTWGIVPFKDNTLVDSIARVTDHDSAVYTKAKGSTELVLRSSTVKTATGDVLKDVVLDATGPVVTTLEKGQVFYGEDIVNGETYVSAYLPIFKESGELLGALFVGEKAAISQGMIFDTVKMLAMLGAVVTLVLGVFGFILARWMTAPIPLLASSMHKIANGALATEVPFFENGNELGAMARAVEIFRQNALKVTEMTEAEAASIVRNQAERNKMMAELQVAFGDVVDAAIAGDFTKRVNANFPDAELNNLAVSVNSLVETTDRGLAETGDVLSALADTDLTRRIEGDYQGAFAKLKADTNAVADKLTDIVGQLRETSGTLKTATGEILSGANDLSERTTKQAATIEETSAAMEQLATTVVENARKAEDASVKAGAVSRSAEEGGQVMAQATEAMEKITTSSSKISNIIGMIDDIAFQTNLLALNASVEAARAGEAGAGFAVVAVEVRRLAQSSAQASSEIKVLIQQSANEVAGGSKLVADAAGKLASMLTAVKENNVLLDGIARASREQASSIEEVNTAVRQMDEMTQHNAALVEEINAAIEQTETQATELDKVVDIFQLQDHGRSARAQVAARPVAKPSGIKGLQQRVKAAASSYLSHGNAAVEKDWSEF